MNLRAWLGVLTTVGALATAMGAIAADPVPSPVDNPVGKWDEYEMIIQVDVPLRGTLRHVYIDRVSAAEAQRTGKLPYGTKIVMRDFVGVPDGKGGWKTENQRLVAGKPVFVLIQQKQKGWGTTHLESIRNGEWEYGLFTPDGKPIPINTEQACMTCHKRVDAADYTFVVYNYFADQVKKQPAARQPGERRHPTSGPGAEGSRARRIASSATRISTQPRFRRGRALTVDAGRG